MCMCWGSADRGEYSEKGQHKIGRHTWATSCIFSLGMPRDSAALSRKDSYAYCA